MPRLAFAVLAPILWAFARTPGSLAIGVEPAIFGISAATAVGTGSWLAALSLRYRDVRYAIPSFGQAWLFASPVAYPASILPKSSGMVFAVNPRVGVIEGVLLPLARRSCA